MILIGLIGVDFFFIFGGSDIIGYLVNLIGVGDVQFIDDLLDQVYLGELDDFLIYFNCGSEVVLYYVIDWCCQFFLLSVDFCVNVK